MNQRTSRIWLLVGALSVCGFTLACESSGGDGDGDATDENDSSRPGGDSDAGGDTGGNPSTDTGENPATDTGGNPSLDDLGLGDINPPDDTSGSLDLGFDEEGLSCGGIIECINGSAGTEAAVQGCIASGTQTGQALIIDALTCIQTNCASVGQNQEAFQACQQEFCANELRDCTLDGGGSEQPIPSGDDTCREIIGCATRATSQAQLDQCLVDGSITTANQAVALYNCAAPGCTTSTSAAEFEACILNSTACTAEAAACQ